MLDKFCQAMQKSTNSSFIIFTRQKSSRLKYITKVIFGHFLECKYQLTANFELYRKHQGPRINYSYNRLMSEEFWMPPVYLLFEKGIHLAGFRSFFPKDGLYASFSNPRPGADFSFDFFSMSFYLLSRYEEYTTLRDAFDQHGRYLAYRSTASKYGFLEIPLVDLWLARFMEQVRTVFPAVQYTKRTFRFVPTFDIDLAWAYRERPLVRHLAGAARDLLKGRWKALVERHQVLKGLKPDPFDTFEVLKDVHRFFDFSPIFFFLLGAPGRYDRNISHDNERLQSLIRDLHRDYRVGIHPSYRSHRDLQILNKEKERLQNICHTPVTDSRFHFLKFKLPESYRRLIKAGITDDYTMGYAARPGFRASTAHAYPWYDLEKEETTSLMIHPFQIMDGTLKNYQKISPNRAQKVVFDMMEKTAEVGGTFSTLWHNSSFSYIEGWETWAPFYQSILEKAYALRKKNL